jgi:hypothetical protein
MAKPKKVSFQVSEEVETSNETLAKTLKPKYKIVSVPDGEGFKQISKEDFTDVDAYAILEFWDALEGFDKEKAIKSIFE